MRATPTEPTRAHATGPQTLAVAAVALALVAATVAAGHGLAAALGGAGRLAIGEGRPWVAPADPPGVPSPRRTVTVVAAPGLDLDLLRQLAAADPTWRELLRNAAVGLMTSHTGGYYGREAGYLTLGAGARAVSGPTAGWVLPGDQVLEPGTAAGLFDRWWPPREAPWPGAAIPAARAGDAGAARTAGAADDGLVPVVHWGWQALRRANEDLDHPVPLGSLATALHRAGMAVAVLGNADLPGGPWAVPRRGAVLMAADQRGWVDLGLIDGRSLEPDASFPGGWRTRWEAVLTGWAAAQRHASLIVIEAGDLGRLEDLAPTLTPEGLEGARRSAGARLGRALAALQAALGPEDRLVLLNPAPRDEARAAGETLLPVATWGAGPGLLTSPSTRRAGLVVNTDVAPSIAAHLGAPPHPAWVGRPWAVVPPGDGTAAASAGSPGGALDALDRLDLAMVANYQRRAAFIRLFVGAGLVLCAGPLLALWRRSRQLERWSRWLLALAAFPLANLLLPAWPTGPGWSWWSGAPSVVLAAGLALAAAAAARRLTANPVAAFGAVGAWTVAVVVADLLAGGWLAQLTPFGYSPIGGARYYGLGNEYMGVLIGAAAVAAAAWAEGRRRQHGGREAGGGTAPAPPEPSRRGLAAGGTAAASRAVPLSLAAVALLLADPRQGSNFGGALSAAVAACGPTLAASLAAHRSLRRRAGAVLVLLAVPVGVGLLMALLDRQMGMGASHVLTTWEQVRGVGPEALADVVGRKVAMNLRLMRYTNWSYLFVMLVFVYAFVIYRRAAVIRRLERRVPEAVRGLAAVGAGSLAALVLNDSGIVAAATTLVYGATLLLALVAGEAGADPPGRGPVEPAPRC
ncbi:hypothetical protein E1B22_09165 [Thermaerobacter sp. FW80]|uniref:hypothetical protein n=1 Tax=Thermaerobacter sp. FW80 TaxID=2546351 RepID=UPI0010757EFB|nr:hypothetical protein [Thermaerobacter sp. FW80]QBS37909.1 hypothetical protein E1B22_09165 [Thermaerobacter sp. FW80]